MEFSNYNLSLKEDVELFTKQLFYALFEDVCREKANHLKKQFVKILNGLSVKKANEIWMYYQTSFCNIREKLDLDAKAFESTDPACKSLGEVYLAYPGFHAIAIYRLSHELYKINVPILPRMMSEYAHSLTGVDIHPGATIGNSFFIDHATGVVIGETTVIENNVSIYQGVTLGGIQVKKELAEVKRHPTIESNVTIYANATILGNITVGRNTVIGANVCITKSVGANSTVIYKSQNSIYT
ncbi:serine acetyltransferase [Tenacibaculum sp. SZ-18]|uniref:serine O-acetyltransferase EpsC n=1 Tax=Tenacibaculum sp. SZ-18 TaxID=754423 RepID=UPI000C2D495F|nr:serine O-acetyltransferase EpsC [Tenacibaculum sp. SZ-18]AUC16065.1 serine acetyltransferase [Tenacibaculum sp. SZ-18]